MADKSIAEQSYEEHMLILTIDVIAMRLAKQGLPTGERINEDEAKKLVWSMVDVKQNLQKELLHAASCLGVSMEFRNEGLAQWLSHSNEE